MISLWWHNRAHDEWWNFPFFIACQRNLHLAECVTALTIISEVVDEACNRKGARIHIPFAFRDSFLIPTANEARDDWRRWKEAKSATERMRGMQREEEMPGGGVELLKRHDCSVALSRRRMPPLSSPPLTSRRGFGGLIRSGGGIAPSRFSLV